MNIPVLCNFLLLLHLDPIISLMEIKWGVSFTASQLWKYVIRWHHWFWIKDWFCLAPWNSRTPCRCYLISSHVPMLKRRGLLNAQSTNHQLQQIISFLIHNFLHFIRGGISLISHWFRLSKLNLVPYYYCHFWHSRLCKTRSIGRLDTCSLLSKKGESYGQVAWDEDMEESECSSTERHWLSVILCRVYWVVTVVKRRTGCSAMQLFVNCVHCNNTGLR